MSGAEMIVDERNRQVEAEGWTPEHDDEHVEGELLDAAALYLKAAEVAVRTPQSIEGVRRVLERHGVDADTDEDFQRMISNPARHHWGWDNAPPDWPWDASWWKPSADPIRNLVRAGALIAAELDRLERAKRCES